MSNNLSHLPLMPLDPAWIEQAPAFHDPDPRLSKAAMQLLFAAWRGSPAGSIPASHTYVSQCTGLDQRTVGERYVLLTEGYELRDDGRLYHVQLAKLAQSLLKSYAKEIESFAMAAAMAAQDPSLFGLMNIEAGTTKPRGKTKLPARFGYDYEAGMRDWAAANGYPAANQQSYVMRKFIDYVTSRGERFADWAAAFRNFASTEISFGRRPPPPEGLDGGVDLAQPGSAVPRSGNSPFANLSRAQPSKGERASAHNEDAIHRARELMGQRRSAV